MTKRKNKKVTANRNYKDTVFRKLFSDRRNLLSLYNAIMHPYKLADYDGTAAGPAVKSSLLP